METTEAHAYLRSTEGSGTGRRQLGGRRVTGATYGDELDKKVHCVKWTRLATENMT